MAALVSMLAAVLGLALSPEQAFAQTKPTVSLTHDSGDIGVLYSDPWYDDSEEGQLVVRVGDEFSRARSAPVTPVQYGQR